MAICWGKKYEKFIIVAQSVFEPNHLQNLPSYFTSGFSVWEILDGTMINQNWKIFFSFFILINFEPIQLISATIHLMILP